MSTPAEFHPLNTATELLAKVGSGTADADFARAIHLAVERASQTKKKAKVVLTVEVDPRDDTGSLVLRALVEARLPKLIPPSTQMHVGPGGELLTQMEFLMSGGPTEAKPKPLEGQDKSASGRHVALGAVPKPGPVAEAPKPAPLADGGPRQA